MNPNRIDPLAPPPTRPEPAPSVWKPWLIRLGASILGVGLGASCPLWPPPLQPVCLAVSKVVQLVPLPDSAPPSKPEED